MKAALLSGIACFFLVFICGGCGDGATAAHEAFPAPVAEPQATPLPEPPASGVWEAVRVRWAAFEIPDGACGEGLFEFYSDGRFREVRCGESKTGAVSAADLVRLNGLVEGVVGWLGETLDCEGPEIADYTEDVMLKVPTNTLYRTVFKQDGEQCFRGERETAEEFMNSIGEIRRTYQIPFD